MQLGSALAGRDWRWNCGRTYERVLAGGRVHLFFIDTNPFVRKYHHQTWANATGALRLLRVARALLARFACMQGLQSQVVDRGHAPANPAEGSACCSVCYGQLQSNGRVSGDKSMPASSMSLSLCQW